MISKREAVRRYVFSDLLQILHINSLTHDFLFALSVSSPPPPV